LPSGFCFNVFAYALVLPYRGPSKTDFGASFFLLIFDDQISRFPHLTYCWIIFTKQACQRESGSSLSFFKFDTMEIDHGGCDGIFYIFIFISEFHATPFLSIATHNTRIS